MEWISVDDRPLIDQSPIGWGATVDGDKEFIAAVPTNHGWWIRHCVLQDETGLCVVGDDDNDPAGWSIEDVTHWMPLPEPPDKEVRA